MRKNIILKIFTILSIITLSSCSCNGCKVRIFECNKWHDFNIKEENYYNCKLNLSLYLENDYFVLGVILGENEDFTFHLSFSTDEIKSRKYSNETTYLDYDKIKYTDSTGETVKFNTTMCYTVNSSRTIKFDYSSWDEEIKNIFNNSYQYSFDFFYTAFVYNKSNKETSANKVDFGDDLSKVSL